MGRAEVQETRDLVYDTQLVSDTLYPPFGDELLSHSDSVACPRRDLLQEQWLIRWLRETTSIG